jgi:uncharacterized protein (DUF433 family)
MIPDEVISDPEILSGTPVFRGTRVSVETLFTHLEKGIPLDVFLDDFPTVSRKQALAVLEAAEKIITAKNFRHLYESAH